MRTLRGGTESAGCCDSRKVSGTRGAIEPDHLVVEVRDDDSRASGVIEVGYVDSHSSARLAIGAEGETGFNPRILECPVALIAIKFVGLRVIGDDNVGPSVAVGIDHCDTK